MSKNFVFNLFLSLSCVFTAHLPGSALLQPNWRHLIVSKYSEGFPERAIYYAPDPNGKFDIPVKEIFYYPDGSVKSETDLIVVDKEDPSSKKFNTTVLAHGQSTTYFPSGNVLKIQYFEKGQLIGPTTVFHPNGQKQATFAFLFDVLHGKKEYYDENGAILERSNYLHGNPDGEKVTFYPNGLQRSIMNYKDGLADGMYEERYENGNIKLKIIFFRGVLNDKNNNPAYTAYYEGGELEEVRHYLFGVKEKAHIIYFPDGKKSYEATYLHGEKNGPEKHFFEDETIKGFGEYRNGVAIGKHYTKHNVDTYAQKTAFNSFGNMIEPHTEYNEKGQKILEKNDRQNSYYIEWYPSGKIKAKYNFHEKIFDGGQQDFYENGQLCRESLYKNGRIENRKEWYQKGQLALNETYENGLIDGLKSTYFPDEEKQSESFYKNGKLTQTSKTWHPNGQLQSTTEYNDDQIIGEKKEWSDQGVLISNVSYDKDKLHGKTYIYYPNGQIKNEYNYAHGKLEGQQLAFYEDGSKKEEKNYTNATPIGKHFEYHPNGKIAKASQFIDGALHGEQKSFYEDGKEQASISYDHGTLNGKRSFWNKDGQVLEVANYINGMLDGRHYFQEPGGNVVISNYSNNRLHGLYQMYTNSPGGRLKVMETNYLSGLLDGEFIEFNQAGIKISSTLYKMGKKEGIASLYYDEGSVKLTVEYRDNEKNGLAQEHLKNGPVSKQVNFRNDNRHGDEVTFYENGQIKTMYTFKEGKLNGPAYECNEDGIKVFEAEFLDGQRHGKFNKYDDFGNPLVLQIYEHDQLIKKEKINL